MSKIEKQANNILDEESREYWRSDTAKTIVAVYKDLLGYGVKADDAKQAIQGVFYAASGEYGE
jgi:hypothetical protein